MLTFGSEPPAGFLDPADGTYGQARRRLLRWSTVFRELKRRAGQAARQFDLAGGDPALRPGWIDLALEFCDFLTEKNMSTETMTSADYAVAELYGSMQARLAVTFKRFASVAKPFQGRHGKSLTECDFEGTDSVAWGWFDLRPSLVPDGLSCWVAWGFRFPNVGNVYFRGAAPALKDVPSVFVGWGDNANRQYVEPPAGWSLSRERAEIVATRPIAEFSAEDPETRTADMAKWIGEQLAELEKALMTARDDGRLWISNVVPATPMTGSDA